MSAVYIEFILCNTYCTTNHRLTIAVHEFLASVHYPASFLSDLSLCNYFLFPKLKMAMKRTLYDDIEAIAAMTRVIKVKDGLTQIYALVRRGQRCIDAKETYFK